MIFAYLTRNLKQERNPHEISISSKAGARSAIESPEQARIIKRSQKRGDNEERGATNTIPVDQFPVSGAVPEITLSH
jgi:hypothetical protein